MELKKPLYALLAFGLIGQVGCSTTNHVTTEERNPAADFQLAQIPASVKKTADDASLLVPSDDKTKSKSIVYYQLVQNTIKPGIEAAFKNYTYHGNYQGGLENGAGYAVKLDDNNYNIHVGFPEAPTGGRSYGWTRGKVGDWSDKLYLDNLWLMASKTSDSDLGLFYSTLIEMLGRSDASNLKNLEPSLSQRVATNFLAIYTAEQYRRMVPNGFKDWDDALFQTTMLAAFHAGQSKFTKFYNGKFTNASFVQKTGVYQGKVTGVAKTNGAELNDYWQYSATSVQSGIHETHYDYALMGKAITAYEASKKEPTLTAITAIIGPTTNVIDAISGHYVDNGANIAETDQLSKAVSAFLVKVKHDADDITAWIPTNFNPKAK